MNRCETLDVWVVGERRTRDLGWARESWSVVSALPGRPETSPGTLLAEGPGWSRYFLGSACMTLYAGETANYKFNLEGSRPSLYVILRRGGPLGVDLLAATVDPGEIDSHADSGDDLIEAMPLPAEIASWVAAFIARHHKDEPFHKRKRDRADPEALGRRPAASGGDHV